MLVVSFKVYSIHILLVCKSNMWPWHC